jgi:type VI secretion system secreted protein VgrG
VEAYVQDQRLLQIETVLGTNHVLLTGVAGEERLSDLYYFDLELVSTDFSITPDQLLGTSATVIIYRSEESSYTVNGIISHFELGGRYGARGLAIYRARLAPALWLLTRTSDCRIFQNQHVKEIVDAVLAEYGIDNKTWKLIGHYEKRDYCVQYRESAYHFICRLLEEEGIFFYFQHTAGSHTIIFSDHNKGLYDCPVACVPIVPPGGQMGGVSKWQKAYQFRSGLAALSDFNFETPSTSLAQKTKTVNNVFGKRGLEKFDYPGRYGNTGAGQSLTKLRIEYEESAYQDVKGEGSCAGFAPGACFSLSNGDSTDENVEYFLVAVEHNATDPSIAAGEAGAPIYTNNFLCRPRAVPYRPEIKTPCPRIHGAQTAIVAGPGGSEIFTDAYGRIKVQFHWDRYGKSDASSSCWVRVAQGWAGKGWGIWFVPRIGQEVVVMFMEGDPDRPLVVGSVYNAEQTVPFPLPGNATQSGVRTRSSMGGSPANCNELRFEDKTGAEQVYFHAERNMDTSVEKDETHLVGHDQTVTIQNDQTITVQNNRAKTVVHNEVTAVGGNRTESVGQNEAVTIALTRTHEIGAVDTQIVGAANLVTVGAAQVISVGASRTVTVGASQTVMIGSALSSTIGSDKSTTVGGGETISVSKDRSTSVGQNESVHAGKTISIEAGDEIVLTAGSASITLKKNGDISIEGKQISINGSGNVIIKGQKILQN